MKAYESVSGTKRVSSIYSVCFLLFLYLSDSSSKWTRTLYMYFFGLGEFFIPFARIVSISDNPLDFLDFS